VWVGDASSGQLQLPTAWNKAIAVGNKCDLLPANQKLTNEIVSRETILPEYANSRVADDWMFTSALTGVGIDELRQRIIAEAERVLPMMNGGATVWNERQLAAAGRALQQVNDAKGELLGDKGCEILAQSLWIALRALEEIEGKQLGEAVVSAIFSGFCIGK